MLSVRFIDTLIRSVDIILLHKISKKFLSEKQTTLITYLDNVDSFRAQTFGKLKQTQ